MKKIFLGFLILVTSSFGWMKTDIIEACVSVKQNYGWSMPVKVLVATGIPSNIAVILQDFNNIALSLERSIMGRYIVGDVIGIDENGVVYKLQDSIFCH
jgi:hypothetical protein